MLFLIRCNKPPYDIIKPLVFLSRKLFNRLAPQEKDSVVLIIEKHQIPHTVSIWSSMEVTIPPPIYIMDNFKTHLLEQTGIGKYKLDKETLQ